MSIADTQTIMKNEGAEAELPNLLARLAAFAGSLELIIPITAPPRNIKISHIINVQPSEMTISNVIFLELLVFADNP